MIIIPEGFSLPRTPPPRSNADRLATKMGAKLIGVPTKYLRGYLGLPYPQKRYKISLPMCSPETVGGRVSKDPMLLFAGKQL